MHTLVRRTSAILPVTLRFDSRQVAFNASPSYADRLFVELQPGDFPSLDKVQNEDVIHTQELRHFLDGIKWFDPGLRGIAMIDPFGDAVEPGPQRSSDARQRAYNLVNDSCVGTHWASGIHFEIRQN